MIQLFQKKSQKQLGRSMVEMLGVLAIIGVLSIGGIAGYSYAMNVYRVNNMLHNLSLLVANALEKNIAYTDQQCASFEESDVTVPDILQTCTITTNTESSATVTVTYTQNVKQQFLDILSNRCSRELYVSSDAKTMIFGDHDKDCNSPDNNDDENQNQDNYNQNPDDLQDPNEWECITNADCFTTEQECVNHKCFRCDVDSGDLSEDCCNYAKSRVSSNWWWEDGICKYRNKCPVHTIQACECEGPIMGTTGDPRGNRYCCDVNESFESCCQAVGGTWCETSQVCIEAGSSISCEGLCAAYSPIENCSCKVKQIKVIDVDTNEEIPYCCDQRDTVYFVGGAQRCCESIGGWWKRDDRYVADDGVCYTEKKQYDICIKVIDAAYYGYSPSGSYMKEACCEEASSKEECCTQKGYYWCAEHQICASSACIYGVSCMGGDRACNYICDPHAFLPKFNCICSSYTISVEIPGQTKGKTYCCDKNDGSLKKCCEAVGFIWDGTGDNTGTCHSETPDICITPEGTSNPSSVCCFGSEQTEQSCCEENDGYYCDIDNKCYSEGSSQFYNMPCMNQQVCENYRAYWCYDLFDGTHDKCISNLSSYLSQCASATKEQCERYNTASTISNGVWCAEDNKCFFGTENFYFGCSIVDETYCKEHLGTVRHWCTGNNQCYSNEDWYLMNCPSLTSEECTSAHSAVSSSGIYAYCALNNKCYRTDTERNRNCH